ncbi:hybrid sensor histidine kinase/response regulator [Chitinophaga sp. G-6-1-13]|uniref:histidine kinase n=1 Tax=Chitinophaga fulva TaxID=2728842 RepID=A0A848GQ81_9BACT|nr:hybrid sensor histidine kinase/response regulator [Chitinophaga fulva]NML39509.1 hybrid sensor histidine kinase/response regulator [Chitinophaga fulva]
MTTKFKILLVDDHKTNLLVLQRMLEAEGRTFVLATSGHEALDIAREQDDIGLVLLDVQMPDMDGYEVARQLKANPQTKDISVIFVTATNKDEEDMLKGFEKGAVDYLPKPLHKHLTRAKVDVFERLYYYQRELKMALKAKEQVNGQLERFMHVVAHDLKSPLSGITSLLLILREEEELQQSAELLSFVDMAVDASHKLADMISAILDYSREHQDNQPEEMVEVKVLLDQLVQLLFPPVNVHIHVADDLPALYTSRQKLQQVFQNLICNAIKYVDKPQVKIGIGGEDRGDYYEFYVKDNGPGIAEKDNERIFRLFEKVDNDGDNGKGTGIGLNILKLLVETQGGKVWVESVKEEGSCFYFQWRK